MSVEAQTWAWGQEAGTAGAKLLLMALANCGDRFGVTFVGRKALAERCECSPRAVTDNLQRLEDRGLIRRVRRHRENGSRTSDYTVLAPSWTDRGSMETTGAEAYPLEIAALTIQGADSSGEEIDRHQVQNLPDPITASAVISNKEEEQSDGRGDVVLQLWNAYLQMRDRSPKAIRNRALDRETRRMIERALGVGSEQEWMRAIPAILRSKHHTGHNDRRKTYLDPRHLFTACTHGTVRQHLDWLLDLAPAQTAGVNGSGALSPAALHALIGKHKRNVLAAYDLAGSDEAKRKGDESEQFLSEHGIRVVRQSAARPAFEVADEPGR